MQLFYWPDHVLAPIIWELRSLLNENQTMNPEPEAQPQEEVIENPDDVYYFRIHEATWAGYPGIVLWGGYYGASWAIVIATTGFVLAFPQITVNEFFTGLMGLVLGLAVFGFIGMMAAGFVGIFTTAAICLFNQTMNHIWSPVTASKISGGLTAFLCTCTVAIVTLEEGNPTYFAFSYLLGPMLAMFCGHIGASRMAAYQIKVHYQRQETRVKTLWTPATIEDLRKFDIRQLLVLTAWFAVIFFVFSGVGQLSTAAAIVLSSYFVLQGLVYFLADLVVRRYVRDTLNEVATQ